MKKSPTKLPAAGSPLPDLSLSKPEPIQLDTPTQIIAPQDLEQLATLVDTPDTLNDTFTKLLTLAKDPKTDMKTKIERDFLLFAYYWANKQGFETENISTFLGFIYDLYHSISFEETDKKKLISEIEGKLRGGGVEGYVGGLTGLSEEQLKSVLQFISLSLLQHFRLYKYVLTKERASEVVKQSITIETVPDASTQLIAPLEEAVPVSFYNSLINPQPNSEMKGDTIEPHDTIQKTETEIEAIKEKFTAEK
ncbi:hypothetical protein LOD99_15786 [Oopsacas minuta]|uniref:Uncharacterized protein n=1 Tax=Oopsacas minuta TaxID=111878 RepID=A0AAV7KB54_9METZ|nr:hypothetical protein LOD99_15786 [Oopsacas minuta]